METTAGSDAGVSTTGPGQPGSVGLLVNCQPLDAVSIALEPEGWYDLRVVREERIIRKDQPAGYYYVQVVGYDGAWNADNSYLLRFKVN